MAEIEYSPAIHETALVLRKSEAEMIYPILYRELKKQKRYVETYQDIQDSGEATELQQTLLMKHSLRYSTLDNILHTIRSLLHG